MRKEKQQRYFIDLRPGCVAVRDRTSMKRTDALPGLNDESPGVVRFWQGNIIAGRWNVPDAHLQAARKLCQQLNAADNDE
jgi:hypothetical protein